MPVEFKVDMSAVAAEIKRMLISSELHLKPIQQDLVLWSIVDSDGVWHIAGIELNQTEENLRRGCYYIWTDDDRPLKTYFGTFDKLRSAIMTLAQCDYDTAMQGLAFDNGERLGRIFGDLGPE